MKPLQVLVLEPFGAGSHASLYRGWQKYSVHDFTVLELPAVHWKWRSRHSCLTLAQKANARVEAGSSFDVVFASDMLSLSEWRGFACAPLRQLPSIVYYHENQFSYPLRPGEQRDYHLAYSNVLTAISADQVWFNSDFHRSEFKDAALAWLRRMPDYQHAYEFAQRIEGSITLPPGVDPPSSARSNGLVEKTEGPSRESNPDKAPVIGWVARWEHDKRPDRFVDAMLKLIERGFDFRLILLGQQFREVPDCMQRLLDSAGDRVLHQGFATSRSSYWRWLQEMDMVVSTADHEFFGIAIVEAIWCGAWPLVPNRLAYPEVIRLRDEAKAGSVFYETEEELLRMLETRLNLTRELSSAERSQAVAETFEVDGFLWERLGPRFDRQLEGLVCPRK